MIFPKRVLLLTALIYFTAALPLPAQSAEKNKTSGKKTVAILTIEAHNVPGYFLGSIENALEYNLLKSDRFYILERRNIEQVILEHKIQRSKVQELAALLPADYLVSGSIEKIGNYQVRLRVISTKDGTILFAYAEQFEKPENYNTVINIMTRNITADIIRHSENRAVRIYDDLLVNLSLQANYLLPLYDFSDIATRGVGVLLRAEVQHTPLVYTFEAGYYNYSMVSDELPEMGSIPLLLGCGYRFDFLHSFYWVPRVFAGVDYTMGERADEDRRRSYSGLEFALKGESLFGIELLSKTSLELAFGYYRVFDKSNAIGGLTVSFGFKVLIYGR